MNKVQAPNQVYAHRTQLFFLCYLAFHYGVSFYVIFLLVAIVTIEKFSCKLGYFFHFDRPPDHLRQHRTRQEVKGRMLICKFFAIFTENLNLNYTNSIFIKLDEIFDRNPSFEADRCCSRKRTHHSSQK